MTPLFRVLLVGGALLSLVFMLRKIRKSEIRISDSTFWFVFAVSLLALAVFPQIASFCSGVFGVESPANFVFLYVVAVLFMREFATTAELSRLRNRLTTLVQEETLSAVDLPKEK